MREDNAEQLNYENLRRARKRGEVITAAFFSCFLSIFTTLLIITFLPKEYFIYRFAFIPFSLGTLYAIASLRTDSSDLKDYLNKISSKEGYPIISVIYVNYLNEKYKKINIALVIFSLSTFFMTTVVDIFTIFKSNYFFTIFPMCIVLLILLRAWLVNVRVTSGVYGSNANEAKELIDFILTNHKDIDFTDGKGNLKKVFLPESLLSDYIKSGVGGVVQT